MGSSEKEHNWKIWNNSKLRIKIFGTIIAEVKKHRSSIDISLCKEQPEIWRTLGLNMKGLQCNCKCAIKIRIKSSFQGNTFSPCLRQNQLHNPNCFFPLLDPQFFEISQFIQDLFFKSTCIMVLLFEVSGHAFCLSNTGIFDKSVT